MTQTEQPAWVTLTPEEGIVWQGRPTLWVVAKQLIVGSIVIGVGIAGVIMLQGPLLVLPIALVLIGAAYMGIVSYKHRQIHYLLTDSELYKKSGLFSQSVISLRLDRIQNTSFNQSFRQRLLTYGTIEIETAGTEGTDLVLEAANDPEHVMGRITERLDMLRSTHPDDSSDHDA